MADDVDMAHELEQLALRQALSHRKPHVALKPRGSCYNCDEPLPPRTVEGNERQERIFCDKLCADDWEQRETSRKRRCA